MSNKFTLLAWLASSITLVVLNGVSHGVLAAGFFDSSLAPLGDAVLKMANFRVVNVVILDFVLAFVLLAIITRWRPEPVLQNEAVRTGALFFLATSATWNIGNSATFVEWPLVLTVSDIIWHTFTGVLAAWIIAKIFNRRWHTGMGAM